MRRMRFRKHDDDHNILAAVSNWVKSRGGDLLVVGGIEIQNWSDGIGKFRVAVHCTGRSPKAQPRKEQ